MEPKGISSLLFAVVVTGCGSAKGTCTNQTGTQTTTLGTNVTEADDVEQLREQVRDAVRCHFEEGEGPTIIRLHFVRDEIIAA